MGGRLCNPVKRRKRPQVLPLLAAFGILMGSSPGRGSVCPGDCDGDNVVGVGELVVQVRIALGDERVEACPAGDEDHNGVVEIDELVSAVQRALNGCPQPTPSNSPTPTPTPVAGRVLSLVQKLTTQDESLGNNAIQLPSVGHDGRRVYVPWTSGLTVFARSENGGTLAFIQKMGHFIGFKPLVAIPSPDGRHVYVLGDNGVTTILRWDDATGRLELVAQQVDKDHDDFFFGGCDGVMTADGRFLYTTGASKVSVLWRDSETGLLEPVQMFTLGMPGGGGAVGSGIALSPDELNVYVAGWGDNRLSVYRRDRDSGRLEFLEEHTDEAVDRRLLRVLSVAVSPDGRHVYAASPVTSSVLIFERDADGDGRLRYVEAVGEPRASWVRVAPDGRYLFVASREDDVSRGGVSVFARGASGDLTFVEFQAAGAGLFLAIDADGRSLYVAGAGTVAAFDVVEGETRQHPTPRQARVHRLAFTW